MNYGWQFNLLVQGSVQRENSRGKGHRLWGRRSLCVETRSTGQGAAAGAGADQKLNLNGTEQFSRHTGVRGMVHLLST